MSAAFGGVLRSAGAGIGKIGLFYPKRTSFLDSEHRTLNPSELARLLAPPIEPDVQILAELTGSSLSRLTSCAESGIADLLNGKELIPIFSGSTATVKLFQSTYNGHGLKWIAKKLAGATVSVHEAKSILAEILEDSLIATKFYLAPGKKRVRLEKQGESCLVQAISERLPRVPDFETTAIATCIVVDLKSTLGNSGALAIDDGAVVLTDGNLELLDLDTAREIADMHAPI